MMSFIRLALLSPSSEIKTVRQFAQEPRTSCAYSESEANLAFTQEHNQVSRSVIDWGFWSLFCTGLFITMGAGFEYVRDGKMSVSELLDIVFRINCHVSFPIREIIDDIPQMGRLLIPLGRIMDLLKSNPSIEPGKNPCHLDLLNAIELRAALNSFVGTADLLRKKGESGFSVFKSGKRGLERAVAASTSPPDDGCSLVSCATADSQFIEFYQGSGEDIKSVLSSHGELFFPLRLTFSKGIRPKRFKGKIEFKNVVWTPPTDKRKPVLNGISFVVEPGQKVALVGPTGCGKSSCMGLLQRLYDPTSGEILIDDIPLKEYDVHHYRKQVVIVDQATVLFNDTIKV